VAKVLLQEKYNLKVLVSNTEDRNIVHRVIYDELCVGKIEVESKKEYLRIIHELSNRGAEAVILGCTEISMLVQQADADVKLYDTTQIHADKAVEKCFQ